jgi:hypothetical protein
VGEPEERRGRGEEGGSRIPARSFFYTRIAPVILVVLAVVTLALIAVAAGVLLGIVPYR